MNWIALAVFIALFLLVTCLGFAAARWRRGDLDLLHEWGLGGRRFGTAVTWFRGDLYTAYTFIAVPALMFGAGATGFFAIPFTIIAFPSCMSFSPACGRSSTSPDTMQLEGFGKILASVAPEKTSLPATSTANSSTATAAPPKKPIWQRSPPS